MNTREKILETAIELFSIRGFKDVSIREITRAVGIKESSLYNHFCNKQRLLDEIFEFLVERFSEMSLPEEEAVKHIERMNPEEFMDMCLMNFKMYFGDPKLIKIWRIISIERFRNEEANRFFIEHLIEYPLKYQSAVFDSMINKGLIKAYNPKVLARAFYSFIVFVYLRYFEGQNQGNPVEDREIQDMIKAHMSFLSEAMRK